jgi:hypothetical protein
MKKKKKKKKRQSEWEEGEEEEEEKRQSRVDTFIPNPPPTTPNQNFLLYLLDQRS